jgi:hypothetical protein
MVYCNGTNWVSMAGGVSATIGGTTYSNTPGGSASQVQYNNGSGGFAGDGGLTYGSGNLNVSGNVSASAFYGDGSHLTGISTQGDRIVSGSVNAIPEQTSGTVRVSGTLALVNTGNEVCSSGKWYSFRLNPSTGMMQMCRP